MYFSGRVHTVIYEDADQAFYILKMVLDDSSNNSLIGLGSTQMRMTVRGNVSGMSVSVGSWFGFEGKWVNDSKFGKQIEIIKAPVLEDSEDPDAVEQMLIGNGLSSQVVHQIRASVGSDKFITALSDVDLLLDSGLDKVTAEFVKQKWMSVQAFFKTLGFLNDLGLPSSKIKHIWSFYGDTATEILSKNPWALVELDGITFQQADSVAKRLHLNREDPNRIKGAVLFACIAQQGFSGNVYLTTGQLINMVQTYVDIVVDAQMVAVALKDLHKDGKIFVDRSCKSGVTAIYDISVWDMEDKSTDILVERYYKASYFTKDGLDVDAYKHKLASVGVKTNDIACTKGSTLDEVVEAAVDEWGGYESLSLSGNQRSGIINALKEPVSILTGLPGTGKTTSLRAAVRIFQEAKIPFLLCAPTGIAAKNLATLTGAKAYTIHRAFEAKGGANEERDAIYAGITGDLDIKIGGFDEDGMWGYGIDNSHPAEVVIIDEASMMDQHLLYRVLSCTSPTCRLLFVGDAAQLPSVGPGNVLKDLINCGKFPVTDLTEIFRQKDTSDIVFASHDIHNGIVPDTDSLSDFVFVDVRGDVNVLATIKKLAESLYGARKNFQILSPRHKGTVGVTNLNAQIRRLLNHQRSGLQEMKIGRHGTIREDDRIMIVKNDYRLGVFNGDVGKVDRIDRRAKIVELKIFGPKPLIIQVPFKRLPTLVRMAYACTVHKAQGLEYDYIIMPLIVGFNLQLQRNLLYTAVTRAKKKVILVGDKLALSRAVLNNIEDQRNTLLNERILMKFGVDNIV